MTKNQQARRVSFTRGAQQPLFRERAAQVKLMRYHEAPSTLQVVYIAILKRQCVIAGFIDIGENNLWHNAPQLAFPTYVSYKNIDAIKQ